MTTKANPTPGIHHMTAIAGDAQQNVDFYTGVLGLRLVKLTVNFDDPGTYHLYYGDSAGRPGTILTFFPFRGAAPGRVGAGQATEIAFAVPAAALDYWAERLAAHGVAATREQRPFGETALAFADPDGLRLALAGTATIEAVPETWPGGTVPAMQAIRGFQGTTLSVADTAPTARLLTEILGLRETGRAGGRARYAGRAPLGASVDLVEHRDRRRGVISAGSVHHVAWRTADDEGQAAWHDELARAGLAPTPVRDRQYFRSIYFHEPGGILFEIATDPPGFATDEAPAELGTSLKLPPWLEPHREAIRRNLPPLRLPALAGKA